MPTVDAPIPAFSIQSGVPGS